MDRAKTGAVQTSPRLRRGTALGGSLLAAGAFVWEATALRPFTLPALVAVVGGGVAAMAGGRLVRPIVTAPLRLPGRAGLWAGLVAALTLWELRAVTQHPRSQHPTISSLANELFDSHASRAVALAAWLLAAAGLGGRLRLSWGRVPVLTVWLWVGWHLFVRAGYG